MGESIRALWGADWVWNSDAQKGVDIIDVGGESTRPGSTGVDVDGSGGQFQ